VNRGSEQNDAALLSDPSVRSISASDLKAVFLPQHGMLCASLTHQDVEILRRLEDLEKAAAKGSTAGIPLLHPWANRLASTSYNAAGHRVVLDPSSPLLHLDSNGLPMHGVPWALLAWELIDSKADSIAAKLDWSGKDLLAIFPYQHSLQMKAMIRSNGLTITTNLIAGPQPVPVSFGFHPYFGIPNLPRSSWRLRLPRMQKLLLDDHGIPTGEEQPFEEFDALLGDRSFDDGFALIDPRSVFSLEGTDRRITVEFVAGFRYAQVFAPKDKDFVAIEPMTARTSALTTARDLELVRPGQKFTTAFSIYIERC
jgi:aldose 1-epimerase